MNGMRALTKDEEEAFLKDNENGVLAFAGDKPYCIPVHYDYKKGNVVIMMLRAGRKMEYIKKSPKVCFNVWQEGERSNISSLKKERNTSVLLEGELEEVIKDKWDYYELPTVPDGVDMVVYIIKVNAVGTVCTLASFSFGGETA